MNVTSKLTIFFEGPFWVGVFERFFEGNYEISKVVFGSEPKDCEVYELILKNFNNIPFSTAIPMETEDHKKINPKRLQRKIKKETENNGIGTKAQNAIKLQMEASKSLRKSNAKVFKEKQKERKFELKQLKKKEKHRGH